MGFWQRLEEAPEGFGAFFWMMIAMAFGCCCCSGLCLVLFLMGA